MFSCRHSTRKRWCLASQHDIWDCSRAGPAPARTSGRRQFLTLITWAWLLHISTKFSGTTAQGFHAQSRPGSGSAVANTVIVKCGSRESGDVGSAIWQPEHTHLPFGDYIFHLWIKDFFSDPVTGLGLAKLNLVSWECLRAELSFEAFKPERSKFYEPEKHKVHLVLTPCAQFAYFPKQALPKPSKSSAWDL